MSTSTGGKERKITYRDVEESPARNGRPLRDKHRVPEQVKDRRKRGKLAAEGRDSL